MPKPRTFRTDAIILKRRDFGEADRLLTLLTAEHGKRDVIAKGARKPASRKTGHVELYTRADALISRGRELDILSQIEMVKPYLVLREDLERGAYAGYAVELLDRFTFEGEEHLSSLFTLLDETLEHLCNETDPRLVTRHYEMHLLDAVGFRPELNECLVTREALQPEDQFFSFVEGGVVSPAGSANLANLVSLPLNTLKVLRHIQRSPYAALKSLQVSNALHADLERVLLGYITTILERQLQSVAFIRRIRRG